MPRAIPDHSVPRIRVTPKMTSKRIYPKRFSPRQETRRNRGISSVISTIIITGTLLVILVVASFVATNILNTQIVSTEFDQAQSNMLLLDSVVQDASLRPGAGGYVQFNEREGGIGILKTAESLSVTASDSLTTNGTDPPFNNLVQFVYSGGQLATVAVDPSVGYTSLRGLNDTYVTLTQGLGFLRLEQDNGAKIKLDYDRVRIVSSNSSAGLIDIQGTNLVQVSFIHLMKGSTNGSGSVNVQVQNLQTKTTTWQFARACVTITVQLWTTPSRAITQTCTIDNPNATRTVVIFSEIQVQASIS